MLVGLTGEPAGSVPTDFPCPVRLLNATVIDISDATPPSPPAAPPPPPPPSPPSPPPSPPYIECSFIACEVISDEEVERLEYEAILRGAVSGARPRKPKSITGLSILGAMASLAVAQALSRCPRRRGPRHMRRASGDREHAPLRGSGVGL